MHIPDGWIDLPTSAAGLAVAATGVTVAARRASVALRERAVTTPAVVAAYLLVAELLVVPLGLGTSAHMIGTGLAAILVGPSVAILCVAVVVVIQALVLADGGVIAIGLNIVNNGIVPALVAYCLFRALYAATTRTGATGTGLALSAGLAAGAATLAAAAAAAVEFVVGGTQVVPAAAVAAALGAGTIVVAGVEGVLTGLIITVVHRLRPDLVVAARRRETEPVPA